MRLAFALSAILWGIILCGADWAFGAPPSGADPNSPLAQWVASVRHPQLGKCCDIADGRFVDAEKIAGGWRVLLDDGWNDVPPEAVLKDEVSPNGSPVVWLLHGRIRCFIPAGAGA